MSYLVCLKALWLIFAFFSKIHKNTTYTTSMIARKISFLPNIHINNCFSLFHMSEKPVFYRATFTLNYKGINYVCIKRDERLMNCFIKLILFLIYPKQKHWNVFINKDIYICTQQSFIIIKSYMQILIYLKRKKNIEKRLMNIS